MGEFRFDCCCFGCKYLRLQIVEHDDVGASACSSKGIRSAAAFHLNLDAEATQGTSCGDCGGDAAGRSNVVVLQHDLRTSLRAHRSNGMYFFAAASQSRGGWLCHHGAEVHAVCVDSAHQETIPAAAAVT
jgi:hypothetical protein